MTTKRKIIQLSLILIVFGIFSSCENFLDVVPDNIATIEDDAFALRADAERFLFTTYSYMPQHGRKNGNPGFFAGDEFWLPPIDDSIPWRIARGNQRVVNPYMDFWEGWGGTDLYEGIRQCNIFLENIDRVPDMSQPEKDQWIAEVKFLKAYYHFYLVRMYGPIVLVRENKPVYASSEEVNVARSPVDECFAYIVELLNEAAPDLPGRVDNELADLGRITRTIALAVKAKVLVTAASPLFNGNQAYAGYTGPDGEELFNTEFDPVKWDSAAAAAQKAVAFAEQTGHELYYYQPQFSQYDLSDTTMVKMSIRNSVAEAWNPEVLWANTETRAKYNIQAYATPRGLDPAYTSNWRIRGNMAPPLKIAELFYSSNGVPLREDKSWEYSERFDLKTATAADRYNLKEGYTTAKLHFEREPRFYASLGFDGGIWYGQGRFDDNGDLFFVASKNGQAASVYNKNHYSVTGYWPKKLVHFENVIGPNTRYDVQQYPWPVMRLADLYLLYAEAKNEADGPGPEVYDYINLVRKRAGLESVQDSWTNHSVNPEKYTTKQGMREIIRHERLIELAFEGKRFWDLRRWKQAAEELNKPISGWDIEQSTEKGYYRERVLFNQRFTTRDYLWPLDETVLLSNTKTVQNPGW